MVEVQVGIALALLVAVVVFDLRSRVIPNWAVAGLALLFLVPAALAGQWAALGENAAMAIVVFTMAAALFQLGWLGGGDVKLGSALALWVGPGGVLQFLLLTSLVGGVVSILCLAWAVLSAWRRGEVLSRSSIQVPYGIAIAAGALPSVLAVWAGT